MNASDVERLHAEIRSRLGVLPSLFEHAPTPEMAGLMWTQAKLAYLDNPMPPLLKERLFVYLSRFCSASYCLLRHAAFLRHHGWPAGDADAPETTSEALMALLERPLVDRGELAKCLALLEAYAHDDWHWPDVETDAEYALIAAAAILYLGEPDREACLAVLRRAMGPGRLAEFTSLVGFIGATHLAAESNEAAAIEADVHALLRDEPELAHFARTYSDAVARERAARGTWETGPRLTSSSNTPLARILEDSLNEIYVFDDQTLRFTRVNRGARENLGYSMDELEELTPVDLKPEVDTDTFQSMLLPLRRGESRKLTFDTVHRRKDGSEYPVVVHLQHIPASREFVALILDTTEAQQRKQALLSSRATLSAVLNAVPDAVLSIDERGIIHGLNPAAESLLGYSESELIGKNVSSIMPSPMREAHDGYLERYLQTGEAGIIGQGRNVEALHRDGARVPVRLTVGEARVGEQSYFTGVLRDLTAENRTRALLEQQAEMLDQTREAILALSTSGAILFANRAAERMFEISRGPDGWTREARQLVVSNVGADVIRETLETVMREGYLAAEGPYVDSAGVRTIHQSSLTRVDDPDGKAIGVVAVIRDIGREREIEEELLETHEKLHALFQQRRVVAGILSLDGTVLDVNAAALAISGRSREELIGRVLWDGVRGRGDEDLASLLERSVARAAAGEGLEFETSLMRADGTLGTFVCSITPVTDESGAAETLLVEATDVTDQRELEEQFLQAQKMEIVGTFAAGIAHDFNNLLTAISGSSEMIERDVEPGSRAARSNERVRNAAERAHALTSQLVAFSRKEAIQPRAFDLNEAMLRLRSLISRMLPENIEIELDLDPAVGMVYFDPSQLDQVVINLAVNARDAMPRGGRLRLSTECVHLERPRQIRTQTLAAGDYIRLAVADTGEGIPEEIQARVFEPFFTTKRRGEGTGLGLSTLAGILTRRGGAIDFESRKGVGTTFETFFPTADPAKRRIDGSS